MESPESPFFVPTKLFYIPDGLIVKSRMLPPSMGLADPHGHTPTSPPSSLRSTIFLTRITMPYIITVASPAMAGGVELDDR